MKKSESAVVKEWLVMIQIACDADSPFAGMVDLSSIHTLPLSTQRLIFDAMTQEQRDRMKLLYGPKEGVGQ